MKKYVIVSDSCCDLQKELREQFDIDYIQFHMTTGGKEYVADLDWQDLSVKEFYDIMRSGVRIFTAQANVEQYRERFEKYINDGYDVLSLSCSSALSASVKCSYIARDELLKKYPDSKIICIDTLTSCYGLGLLCIRASELRKEGKTIEEVAEWVEQNKLTSIQEATTETLTYMKQAGRVSASAAFFGGLFNIKPIIISDAKGHNFAVEKVKGRQTAIKRVAERVKEQFIDVPYQRIFICHADCTKDAYKLKDAVLKELDKDYDVCIGDLGPMIGATVGPGTIAVYFYGKEVTINKD